MISSSSFTPLPPLWVICCCTLPYSLGHSHRLPQICFSFHLYRTKNALDSHASTVVGAVLGQRTVDTRVHAESCEPNISSLKQTKGHLSCRHCEGKGVYEGVGGWGCGGGGEASVRSDRLLPLLLARPPLLHLHLHLHTGANNSQLFWSRKWWHKLNHLLLRVQANIALKLTIFSRLDSPAPFVLAESGHLNFKLDSPHIVRNWVNFVTAPTLPQLFQYFYAALDDFTQFIIIEVPKRDFRKGKFGFCLCCPVLIIWKCIKLYYIHYIGIADF